MIGNKDSCFEWQKVDVEVKWFFTDHLQPIGILQHGIHGHSTIYHLGKVH
jgi:hypothetical protein